MTTEMRDNETVDDVLADMLLPRFDAITAMRANNYDEIKSLVANYRDRIGAAHKREIEKLNSAIQATVSRSDAEIDRLRREAEELRKKLGDAAAMRELVRRIVKSLGGKAEVAPANMTAHEVAILNQCRAALSAPPRNCDVGTPEEQRARFDKFCRSNSWDEIDGAHCMSSCPLYHGDCSRCEELEWAQMPYEEGETDGK